MRKITETLRLHYECGRTHREISRAIGASPTTVGDYLRRAKVAGLSYPLPDGLDESALELRLFPPVVPSDVVRPEPDWVWAHREMRKKSVTLELLWQEYKAAHSDGYQYSWFCERYRQWVGKLSVTMRQTHTPGEKLFVDYAGQTLPIIDGLTGEIRHAQLFVAVLGASNYTFAEATWTQQLSDWVSECHAEHRKPFCPRAGAALRLCAQGCRAGLAQAKRRRADQNCRMTGIAAPSIRRRITAATGCVPLPVEPPRRRGAG